MTLGEWVKKYTDEDGNIEGWAVINRVLDDLVRVDTRHALVQGRDVDAVEIKGAASTRTDKEKYPQYRFIWCTQREFWEKYCELDGGTAATLKMPDPKTH